MSAWFILSMGLAEHEQIANDFVDFSAAFKRQQPLPSAGKEEGDIMEQNPDLIFLETKQEPKKLSIALSRYFGEGPLSPELRNRYENFLRLRIRAAMLAVIREGSVTWLKGLLQTGWLTPSLYQEAIRQSAALGRTELAALLFSAGSAGASLRPVSDYALEIFELERLWIYDRLPMLGLAARELKPVFAPDSPTGTDGISLFYCPEKLFHQYLECSFHRVILHMIFHCLYLHILPPGQVDPPLWDLACDLFVTRLIDRILPKNTEDFSARQKTLRELEKLHGLTSAEQIYQALKEEIVAADPALFSADSHHLWYSVPGKARTFSDGSGSGPDGSGSSSPSSPASDIHKMEQIRRQWQQIRLAARTGPRRSSARGAAPGSRVEMLLLEKKGRYDFRRYLKRFAVTGEEMQSDPDSFDYIPYYYGLTRYDQMPFIEPPESCEVSRVQELVIAIDTSGSCSLPVVRRFLEETCSILTDRQNFFTHMNVHILQCDSMIQGHAVIKTPEDWNRFSRNLRISGRGGTDFTPVFTYIEKLKKDRVFKHLRGLLYFTDGDGIYPSSRPDYETAFVFTDYRFLEYKVPPWAIRLCLDLHGEGNEVLEYEH